MKYRVTLKVVKLDDENIMAVQSDTIELKNKAYHKLITLWEYLKKGR